MPLPEGIFNSFKENPGSDLDATTGLSVLDTLNENSPLFKALGKSRKMISSQVLPEQSSFSVKSSYETNDSTSNENHNDGEKEIPTTEELLRRIQSGRPTLNEVAPVRTQPIQQYTQPQQTFPSIQPSASPVIDYSLINSMLKSIIEEQMKGLKSQILTESKKSTTSEAAYFTVGGNSIKFVDKKGNVFEGRLKLIGNAND